MAAAEQRRLPCAHCGAECTGAYQCSECTGKPLCEKCYRESVAMVPTRPDDRDRMVSTGELARRRFSNHARLRGRR